MIDFKGKDTILVDADGLLYKFTIRHEYIYYKNDKWKNKVGYIKDYDSKKHEIYSSKEDTLMDFDNFNNDIIDKTGMKIIYVLGGKGNFRYDCYPDYKGNRKNNIKPINFDSLKQHIYDNYETITIDGIEADDVLGIYNTYYDNYILSSMDKDLKQNAGIHYNFLKDEFFEVTFEEGERFFYYQTIVGDTADGYGGIPLIGEKKANKILDMYERDFKKQEEYTEYSKYFWFRIKEELDKRNLNYDYLLGQARCARMLDKRYYDLEKREINLWTP